MNKCLLPYARFPFPVHHGTGVTYPLGVRFRRLFPGQQSGLHPETVSLQRHSAIHRYPQVWPMPLPAEEATQPRPASEKHKAVDEIYALWWNFLCCTRCCRNALEFMAELKYTKYQHLVISRWLDTEKNRIWSPFHKYKPPWDYWILILLCMFYA